MTKHKHNAPEPIAGEWKQVTREVLKEWGKLTEIDGEQIKGERIILAAKIQQRYGIDKEEANLQIDKWVDGRRI